MFGTKETAQKLREELDREAARINANNLLIFQMALADWKTNAEIHRAIKIPVPPPPVPALKRSYTVTDDSTSMAHDGPDRVAPLHVEEPPPPPPPKGFVDFGPAMNDGTGRYLVGPADTVDPGTVVRQPSTGNEYIKRELGAPPFFVWRFYEPKR